LAKANFFSEVGDIYMYVISKASVCICLPGVCRTLNAFLDIINFLIDPASLTKIKEDFYAIARSGQYSNKRDEWG
jgi:hypothetical protein